MLELSEAACRWLEAQIVDIAEHAIGDNRTGERLPSTRHGTAVLQSQLDRIWLEMERIGYVWGTDAKEHRLVCGNPLIDPEQPELGRDLQQLTINLACGPDVWDRNAEALFKGEKPMPETPVQPAPPVGDPVHTHDCEECVFKGTVAFAHGRRFQMGDADVYRCEQRGIPTWIARYGSDGPDYTTLPEHMVTTTPDGVHPLWDLILPFVLGHLSNPELW